MIDVAGRGNESVPMIWYSLGVSPKTNCDDGSSSTRFTVATMLASVCILSRRGHSPSSSPSPPPSPSSS